MARPTTVTVFGDTTIASNDVEDEEANSTSISGPPGLEICDPEVGCSRSYVVAVGELHGTDSNADRAGQRVGEPYRRGLLASDMCGLDGEVQRPPGSSGDEEDPVEGRDPGRHCGNFKNGGQRQLIDIACIPDQGGRLDALWQNLAATAGEAAARQLFGIMCITNQQDRLGALWQYTTATVGEVLATGMARQNDEGRRVGVSRGFATVRIPVRVYVPVRGHATLCVSIDVSVCINTCPYSCLCACP